MFRDAILLSITKPQDQDELSKKLRKKFAEVIVEEGEKFEAKATLLQSAMDVLDGKITQGQEISTLTAALESYKQKPGPLGSDQRSQGI